MNNTPHGKNGNTPTLMQTNSKSGTAQAFNNGSTLEDWDDPQVIPDELPDVMPFDYELLPSAFRPRVFDIATRMGCPPDFSAAAIIVACAAVIGRKITICPKRRDDWTVVPNLWGCVVGRPG